MKHTCVAARIGDGAKRGAANMSILASRATKRPAQGGAGSKRLMLGCGPGAGQESARDCAFLTRAFTVASPETGAAVEVEQGPQDFLGDATRDQTHRDRPAALDRLQGQIPEQNLRGPSSALRRSLLHVSARRRFWQQPLVGWREFWPMALSPATCLGRAKRRVRLRALSQNRASASRVSW